MILETDGSGDETARNVYGTNLLVREVDSDSYYYFYNGHADVTALMDTATDTIDASYYYDAFGNILESTGSVNNNIKYAGYQYDEETGYYYLNSRMYDPITARFLQEDTFTGDPNDPLSLNLYTYVKNNPLIYTDPTGHFGEYIAYEIMMREAKKIADAGGTPSKGLINSINYANREKVKEGGKGYHVPTEAEKHIKDKGYTLDGRWYQGYVVGASGVLQVTPPDIPGIIECKTNITHSEYKSKYDTLPEDYPFLLDWQKYVVFNSDQDYDGNWNINPEFLGRLAYMAAKEGIVWKVNSGYRSFSKQGSFTGQLSANEGESWHNYGLAVDIGQDPKIPSAGKKMSGIPRGLFKDKALFEKYGLCREAQKTVTKEKEDGTKEKVKVWESWHITPIDCYPRNPKTGKRKRVPIDMKEMINWTYDNAYYKGIYDNIYNKDITTGWPLNWLDYIDDDN